MTDVSKREDREVHPVSREAVLAQFPALMAAIPDAVDDDGSGILANVLMSADPLNAASNEGLPEAEDMIGKILRVEKLSKRESTLADSESTHYLVVEGVEGPRHEPFIFGTSSRTIMHQLAAAYALGQIPCIIRVIKPVKATRAGYWPLSVERVGPA